ncbi:hypothetical protein DPMN_070620 [Dreissena polymorpha]|uniref:Uncharacterized protein n=1 Tax=Dreissena polymorpha TaxID=45954 RepID=A0A9D3Z1B4_DREPO|nr:hypothetical protein DPMN_070620 [Dreissena polymorpha]
MDPDETPRSVASHLDPNCLQRPSKFGDSTERVQLPFHNGLCPEQPGSSQGYGVISCNFKVYLFDACVRHCSSLGCPTVRSPSCKDLLFLIIGVESMVPSLCAL